MTESLSLQIFADEVNGEIKKGADFHRAFFTCFPSSGYFEHERDIIMSKVGKILNSRKQLKKVHQLAETSTIVRNLPRVEQAASQSELFDHSPYPD